MNKIEAIFLGGVQGLTEFVPISSSGHLVISQTFLNGSSSHLFLEYINIGTLLALLIYFRSKIKHILKDSIKKGDTKLLLNILITALPAGLVGYLFASFIETNSFFSNLFVVALAMGIVGVVMIVLEKLPRLSSLKNNSHLSYKRALAIGIAQVAALIPGVSRAGSTIIAGRLVGLNYKNSAEYSFLVSIPVMVGVCIKLLLSSEIYFEQNIYLIVVSNIAAFIAGIIAISFLVKYLSSQNLVVFGWYRIAVSLILIIILLQ